MNGFGIQRHRVRAHGLNGQFFLPLYIPITGGLSILSKTNNNKIKNNLNIDVKPK